MHAEPRPHLIILAEGTQVQGLRTVTGDISLLVWAVEVVKGHFVFKSPELASLLSIWTL